MDFAHALRALMDERGISGNALARRVHCDKGLISKYVNGKKQPSAKLARLLDEALGAGGELAALAPRPAMWRPPGLNGTFSADEEERLALAVQRPSRIDVAAVDSLAAVLAAQRELEDRIGSAPMLAPVAAQVTATGQLVSETPAPLRDRVLDVAAQYGYLLGWLHESTGQLPQATALYDRSLGQATEAGDANLVSELISMKGHIAWARGDPAEVVRLSQAAQRDPAVFPGQHAISAMQEARAHAVFGDARSAGRKLADADRALDAAGERDDERPPWLYYHSPGFFTVQRGRVWLHLGAADPRYNAKAIEVIGSGVAALDATAQGSEWGATYLLHLARAHMQDGDAEHAAAVLAEAAVIARRLASAALLARVRRLHARMAERWPDVPVIADLAEALR
jgi:transcriptional regulator with XRE-family HTH domain